MSQFSLFDCDYSRIAGLMPAVRAAMRRAAGHPDGEGRKALVDKISATIILQGYMESRS